MEWSRSSDQSGYLYSSDPNSHLPVWEFTSIDSSTYEQLEGSKLKVHFSSVYIPPGGDTIDVRVGQMVLARHVKYPMTIYAIKLVRQEKNKVFVKYTVIVDD